MYQSKSRRKLLYVDMFPMINLALIVLMFLLICGRPTFQCPIRVNLPIGHLFNTVDYDSDFINILVGNNKVMLALEYPEVREDALKQMAKIYSIPISSGEVIKFGKTDFIGTPLGSLKQYIKNYYSFSDYYAQPGLLQDLSCNDELFNWIKCSRRANFRLHNSPLRIAIQADGETSYPVIKNIIDVLHKQGVNKFTILYSYLPDS